MTTLNGSTNQSDDSDQNNINIHQNGRTVMEAHNGNGLNNNREEYKVDMKLIGSEKVAEDDPLTGQTRKVVVASSRDNQQPRWSNRFASTNFFMVIFLLAYVLQGCYFTYFVSVITTIEKLFHVKSAHIALLLNFSEIGQICTSLLLTYFAGRGHRPRWIACGMFLFSIAAFGSVSPHFMFGSRLYEKSLAAAGNEGMKTLEALHNSTFPRIESRELCLSETRLAEILSLDLTCEVNAEQDNKPDNLKKWVLGILAVSLLGIGIGQTAIATLGIPYIDDNVKSKQSPLYMAITIGVRVLGPALGYYLGSACMRLYVNPTMNIDHTNPNFIGAWWLGLIFVSTSMFFASLIMFTFPKNLRNKTTQVLPAPTTKLEENTKTEKKNGSGNLKEADERSKLEDFYTTIKRQLKNDILMFRTASAVLHLLPITGLYVFLPKYLENQFHTAPSNANFISGTFGILMMGVGILVTGIISVKFSLSARKVALWIAFTALATAFGMLVLSTIGCPMDNYKGLQTSEDSGFFGNSKQFVMPCKTNCLCDNSTYDPICGSDGLTYFSPCHAGCSLEIDSQNDGSLSKFANCTCMPDKNIIDLPKVIRKGPCDSKNCNRKLQIFVAIFALTVFIHSTSEVGGMLIIMRCTDPKDKAMAMGIIQFSIGLLSNIPCPNIYARIIDATCIVWTKICGKNGHCSLYDSDSFRRNFFGISCCIMLLAFVMDIIVYFKSHRIDIDPEAHTSNESTPRENVEENLLRLRKMSHDDTEEVHMKIPIADEN